MLFSGAAISLAAWGHWVPERSRPALLPVRRLTDCLPARLSICMVACVSLLIRLSVCYSCFPNGVDLVGLPVCVNLDRGTSCTPGIAALGSETVWQIIGASLKITRPCSVDTSRSVSPLLRAPVLNSAGKVVKAIKATPALPLPPSPFFTSIIPFAHSPSFPSSSLYYLSVPAPVYKMAKVSGREKLDIGNSSTPHSLSSSPLPAITLSFSFM